MAQRYTVSSLTPSRMRPELLEESLKGLGDLHEHLVYVDDDDPRLEDYKKIKLPNLTLHVGPRHTYKNFQNMVNKLAEMSTGDWLLLWNDDAVMETENWTDHIQHYDPGKPAVLNIHFENNNYFPLISRRFYNILGHYSLSAHCDSWVQEIAQPLGIHYDAYDKIDTRHIRDDLNDEVKIETRRIAIDTGSQHGYMRFKEQKADLEKMRAAL